ncbi:MAG TPA: hypothetical protein VHY82_00150 [Acetobacteraceae bacterium]|nr:hypothetical protein [Acetobacteraceae bacterium]
MAVARPDDPMLVRAFSGRAKRLFMITGIGVHDRTDWPFTITGIRTPDQVMAMMRLHGLGSRSRRIAAKLG